MLKNNKDKSINNMLVDLLLILLIVIIFFVYSCIEIISLGLYKQPLFYLGVLIIISWIGITILCKYILNRFQTRISHKIISNLVDLIFIFIIGIWGSWFLGIIFKYPAPLFFSIYILILLIKSMYTDIRNIIKLTNCRQKQSK
jgi:hypothetical protein